jgi:hypothetical protein
VRGDETQPTPPSAGAAASQERTGPRHAAPRKSLLTKLQMPAGKAIALAAMPTAVFMSLGLTPKLALADEADIPFAPGPCVTRSDEPAEETTATPSASPSASASASASASETPTASASPSSPPSAEPTVTESPSASASPSASPSAAETTDPLGVVGAVKDLLGIDDTETASATPTETETAEPTEAETETASPTATATATPSDEPTASPTATSSAVADRLKEAAAEADAQTAEPDSTATATASATGSATDDATDSTDSSDTTTGSDGKEPYPCPTADPEALAAAQLDDGFPRVADDPWVLKSSALTLRGLEYEGIVEVKTGSGKIKKVLKFTADEIDIKDLDQLVVGPGDTTIHAKAAAGSTSTFRGGKVTMYTEKLEGNLFGLIPLTFSPETPPPLPLAYAVFTDVTVTQAGQFGGTLTIPGLRNTLTPN